MFPTTIAVTFIVVIISLLQTTSYAQDRTLISKVNPGCLECNENTTLVYVKAVGHSDTIHQIWDFTRGAPTMIFVIAGVNSSIEVGWDGMKPNKFVMSEKPHYSFATAMDKLYEYNDLGDIGRIDWHMPQRIQTLKGVAWRIQDSILTSKEAMVRMQGTLRDGHRRGIIDVKLDMVPYRDSAAQLPHLIHTANSTSVDVSLVNVTTSRHYNSSRFAVHLLLASTDPSGGSMRTVTRKSLDDEHTPGVFEIIEIKTPESFETDAGAFVQFRPIAYTQSERGVASSTVAHITDLERATLPERSTLVAFYGGFDQDRLLVEDTLISFGEPGDGFYKQHNYTAWSFTIGYGSPPMESFSSLVIAIISVGLGVPVVLAMSGVVYVLVRRRRQRNTPARLTEED